jgi:hypothetical protein
MLDQLSVSELVKHDITVTVSAADAVSLLLGNSGSCAFNKTDGGIAEKLGGADPDADLRIPEPEKEWH